MKSVHGKAIIFNTKKIMSKNKYLLVGCFLSVICILAGCVQKGKNTIGKIVDNNDSVAFVSESDNCKQTTVKKSLKEQLLGYWAYEGVTWMRITEDSIYYVDQDGEPAIKYFVSADTITMYYYGFTKKDRFWFVGDSLFIENKSGDGGIGKYERVR